MTEGLSFDSVVTIGLGGLRDLSKGLATRRERDLDKDVSLPPNLGFPKPPVKRRPRFSAFGVRADLGIGPDRRLPFACAVAYLPIGGGLGDGPD
jgi:hypothetical protein